MNTLIGMGLTTADVPHSACVRTYAVKHHNIVPQMSVHTGSHTHTHTNTKKMSSSQTHKLAHLNTINDFDHVYRIF